MSLQVGFHSPYHIRLLCLFLVCAKAREPHVRDILNRPSSVSAGHWGRALHENVGPQLQVEAANDSGSSV
jgi:hypothetical protein